MIKNLNIFFPVSLLLFIVVEIFLVKLGQFQVGIFFYIVYTAILYFIDEKYILTFFVYHLPLLPIIPTDYKLLSIVGPHEIIYGFSFFVLYPLVKNRKIRLNKYQKLSIAFIYFLFFIELFPIVKNIFFGIYHDKTKGIFYIFKNLVRYYLYYTSFVFLIKIIYREDLYKYIIVGIKYAVVTITVSMVFTKELILMGAGVGVAKANIPIILSGAYQRFVGFYGAGGDENSVGIFMAAAFGFFLALYEKNKNIKPYIIFMGFAVLGVLLTGSRTSFMALASVILVFMVVNKSGKSKIAIVLACIAFYFVFSKQLNLVIQRFFQPDAKEAIDPGSTGGRIGKWILYTEWILNNPETFFIGNLKKINFVYAPHNYFIFVLYHVGIFPLLFFLRGLMRLFKITKVSLTKITLRNIYYIIPFPFIIMTVNSFGSSIYLWLFLPMGAYFLSDKNIIKLNV